VEAGGVVQKILKIRVALFLAFVSRHAYVHIALGVRKKTSLIMGKRSFLGTGWI
jgi:hypothetical protein